MGLIEWIDPPLGRPRPGVLGAVVRWLVAAVLCLVGLAAIGAAGAGVIAAAAWAGLVVAGATGAVLAVGGVLLYAVLHS